MQVTSGNGSASIGVGYGSATDSTRQGSNTNAVSSLSAGHDLKITAGRDLNSQGGQLSAQHDIKPVAGRDMNFLSVQDKTNYEAMHEKLFAGVSLSVSSSVASTAQSVTDAAKKVSKVSDGYSAANAAFASLKAYDALDNIAKGGNLASVSLTAGFTYEKQKSQGETSIPIPTTLRAGHMIDIDAGRDLIGKGVQMNAGVNAAGKDVSDPADENSGKIKFKVGRDLILESAQATNSASSSNKSAGANLGVSAGLGLTGPNIGLTGGLNFGTGSSNSYGTTQLNAHVNAKHIELDVGNDAILRGAAVSADDVKARIGGDLTIISVPDTGTSKDKSAGFGMQFSSSLDLGSSLSGGMPDLGDQLSNLSPSSLNPSGGRGSGTTSWITEQSGLVSKHRMDVEVKGDTLIDAGKIVSDDGDLKLKTATLTHKDFEGEKRFEGGSVDLSIDVTGKSGKPDPDNPTRNDTLEGSYKLDDTRQKVRATVGPGTIEITDPQKQAKLEADGVTPPLSELNRDPDAAMEITRDKHVDLEVYLSDNSVKAAMDTLKTVGSTVSDALAGMLNQRKDVDPKTKAAAFSLIAEVLKENVSLDELKACGKQGFNQFNPFNWIVTPAYAGGVCDQFPKVVIDLCLDGMDTLRNVLVHGGADALAYLSRRIQDDPKGFNDLVRVLNLLPSNLAMAPLEKSLNDEIAKNGGDPDIISKYVGTFLREQAAAVERGELSPEAAAAIAIGVTALVAKLTPKLVRGKVVSKVIQSAKVVFEAAERKGVGELARPSPNSVGHVVLGDLDELGRPSGVLATITKHMLNTGSLPSASISPPGFGGGANGHARGHLLANLLGGTGKDARNLVAIFQNPANHPVMSGFEEQIAAAVRRGEVVNFRAVPIYSGSSGMPIGVTLTAKGSGGFNINVTVRNTGKL